MNVHWNTALEYRRIDRLTAVQALPLLRSFTLMLALHCGSCGNVGYFNLVDHRLLNIINVQF